MQPILAVRLPAGWIPAARAATPDAQIDRLRVADNAWLSGVEPRHIGGSACGYQVSWYR